MRRQVFRAMSPSRPIFPAALNRLSHQRALVIEPLEERALLNATVELQHLVVNINAETIAPDYADTAGLSSPGWMPPGITPAQMRTAYGLDTLGDGAGQTIAIVVAYDNPALVSSTAPGFLDSDLHQFDVQFGLPDPPSFLKVDQRGGTDYPREARTSGWAVEAALEVEWAHAIAPGANILLVEADNSGFDSLLAAVDYARQASGVVVVSMNLGYFTFPGESVYDGHFTTPAGHNGVTFLSSAGDWGAPGSYPAYAPTVVAVGGTTITTDGSGVYIGESGWSDSGGGQSVERPEPNYQYAVQHSGQRQTPDVAFAGGSPVAVYDSYGRSSPWIETYGTGLSVACWAGLVAIADQLRAAEGLGSLDSPQTLSRLYQLPSADFHDITTGNNGYAAGVGYDMVTGLGTPVADRLVPDLALCPESDLFVLVSQTGGFVQGDVGNTYTITVGNNGDSPTTGQVSLVDILPAGLTAMTFGGPGWTTDLATLTATRDDPLAPFASYPPLTLTVNAAADAPANVVNTATVAGGGELRTDNNTIHHSTIISPAPDLVVTMTHTGDFQQGDVGDAYSITVSNVGQGPTNRTVSVSDLIPAGLTAMAFSGSGWTIDVSTLTATRSDTLPAGASYPMLTLTVGVAASAPASVTNTATVSGGGDLTVANNTALDPTIIAPRAPGTLPTVTGIVPSLAGGTMIAGATSLAVNFNDAGLIGVGTAANYALQSVGPDGLLGTADDLVVPLEASSGGMQAALSFPALTQSVYRLTVRDAITDAAGNRLDGNGDGMSGGDFICDFAVVPPGNPTLFGSPRIAASRGGPNWIKTADFNNDGNVDLVAGANIYIGNGAGEFATGSPLPLHPFTLPTNAGVGDFNRDGNLDVAIINSDGAVNSVRLFLGDGTGNFSLSTEVDTGGSNGNGMSVEDFNNDGKLDVAVANNMSNDLSVLFGDGNGGLAATTVDIEMPNPWTIAAGDFNGDHNLDLVVGSSAFASDAVRVFWGNGLGGFPTSTVFAYDHRPAIVDVAVDDFDRDGNLDFAVIRLPDFFNGVVDVRLGDGMGGFSDFTSYQTGGHATYEMTSGDFNGDGNPDLAVANGYWEESTVGILLGTGTGDFGPVATIASGGECPRGLAVADFNNDSRNDLIIGNVNSRNLTMLSNTYLLGLPESLTSPHGYTFDVQPGDFAAGQLVEGTGNSFDGLNRLVVNGTGYAPPFVSGEFADSGQSLSLPAQTISDLAVSRRITVPNSGNEDFVRTIDTFANPTIAPITAAVTVVGNLGSDGSTTVFATSDGSGIVSPNDMWIGTDDADGSGTPAVIHYVHGPAGLRPTSVSVTGDNVLWTYNITVPAGQTVSIAYLTIVGSTRAEAIAAATALVTPAGLSDQAAAFLDPADLASLGNFEFPAVAATVSLDSHSPLTNDIMTATATTWDAAGLPVSLTYVWKVNGITKQTHTSVTALTDTFDLSAAGCGDRGDVVTIEVTPSDGLSSGTTMSDTATVADTAPVATVTLNIPAPLTSDVLTATASKSDADGDSVTLTYVWKVNGTIKQIHTSATALTDTLDLGVEGNGDKGDVVTVEVTPSVGSVVGATVIDTVTVADATPAATVVLDTHAPLIDDVLTATATKSDADGDPVILSYVWMVNGTIKQTHSSATDLTDTFDLAGNGDRGDVITVKLTPISGVMSRVTVTDTTTIAGAKLTWDGGGSDNNWMTPANWSDNVAPTAGDYLVFAGAAPATANNDFPAGTAFSGIEFASGDFTLSGNSVTLTSLDDVAIKNLAGHNRIDLPITQGSTGAVIVLGGILQLGVSAQALVLSDGGADIQGGALVFDYTGTAPVTAAMMTTSYRAGAWDAGQLRSTTADATHGLAWTDSAATSQLIVRYALYGDVTLDGSVDNSDLILVGQYWSGTDNIWMQGDFNYDGAVNLSDLTLLGQNWNQSIPGFIATGMTATPVLLVASGTAVSVSVGNPTAESPCPADRMPLMVTAKWSPNVELRTAALQAAHDAVFNRLENGPVGELPWHGDAALLTASPVFDSLSQARHKRPALAPGYPLLRTTDTGATNAALAYDEAEESETLLDEEGWRRSCEADALASQNGRYTRGLAKTVDEVFADHR